MKHIRSRRLPLAAAGPQALRGEPAHSIEPARLLSAEALGLERMLQSLVREGFLEAHNPGRGAVYCLPGAAIPRPEEVFGDGSEHSIPGSAHLAGSSAHLTGEGGTEERRDAKGRLLADQLDAPVIDSLDKLAASFRKELEALAAEPRAKAEPTMKAKHSNGIRRRGIGGKTHACPGERALGAWYF